MVRFFLTGQRTFGNRGCEAIVRSTVVQLNRAFGPVEVVVPSDDIARDRHQWPCAGQHGVRFVDAYLPAITRPWAHLQRLPFSALKQAGWPFPFPQALRDELASVDAVLSVGGDNYSLDYRLPSLLMGMDSLAMDLGKPVILWGASVGPFEAEPRFAPVIREHLARMTMVAARESITYRYLTETLSLDNVMQMADPAFTLAKEDVSTASYWPDPGISGIVGLNISPLIERYKSIGQDLRAETIQFVRNVVAKGFGVLLVPHVIPLDGAAGNNDFIYMQSMLADLGSLGRSATIMPAHFNASQIKHVISQLRFFIGARTHATIAALSSGVPTLSVSYSVKAKGINEDLLGDLPVVLPTHELSAMSLMVGLDYLLSNEKEIKSRLESRLPDWLKLVDTATCELAKRIR